MQVPQQMLDDKAGTKSTKIIIHIIDSMTEKERHFPQLVMNVASRKKRILKGSGRTPQEFNDMLKQFKRMGCCLDVWYFVVDPQVPLLCCRRTASLAYLQRSYLG